MTLSKANRQFKLGLLVNPYAGIGGALALKGSDGAEIREKALAMGAEKKALDKTRLALEAIVSIKNQVQLYVAAGDMGGTCACFSPKIARSYHRDWLVLWRTQH